ncbi:MAG: polyphenol oxidase family protein [Myxococcales bacterium]|nr:polyphenol oxidase family protein [Myxococcales bacterium]
MLLTATILARAGFAHAFPTRAAPHAALLAQLGVTEIVQVRQVHGGRVALAGALGPADEADAIVARRPARSAEAAATVGPTAAAGGAIAVGVRVADCVPVLLADAQTGDAAAVHAGWRGVVAGVVPAAVRAMGGGGALLAAVGPCIGACCFEVGREVAEQIVAACRSTGANLGAGASIMVRTAELKAHVDLRAAVRSQLRAAGVDDGRIEDVPGCTKHETHFHSYRRDGPASGRMLAAIATR